MADASAQVFESEANDAKEREQSILSEGSKQRQQDPVPKGSTDSGANRGSRAHPWQGHKLWRYNWVAL